MTWRSRGGACRRCACTGRVTRRPRRWSTGCSACRPKNPQASRAVATRTPGINEAEFAKQFDDGVMLRTHVLRSTWHFVRPNDIRWLVGLTAPRVRKTYVQVQRANDLDDATVEASAEVIVAALSGGNHLTRDEMGERLRDAGFPAEGQKLGVMLANAELEALICSVRCMAGSTPTR